MRNLPKKKIRRAELELVSTEIERTLGSARVGLISLGSQRLPVPGFMPALNGTEDLKALLSREIPRKELHGIVINQYNADKILLATRQHDKESIVGEGVKWSDFRKGKPLLFDPVPELFYLSKPYLRKRLSDMRGAPGNFFSRMQNINTDNHVSLWNQAIDSGEYYALLNWLKGVQMSAGSPVVVPLTPFIDGNGAGSVHACLNANMRASDFLRDILEVPHTMYFGINHTAFKSGAASETIFSSLYTRFQSFSAPNAIVLRIRGLPNAEGDDNTPTLGNVGTFMQSMGTLAEEYKIPLFLFNAGTYGLPAIEYGFNSFSERMNGSMGDPADPDPDIDTKIPKAKQYGKVYHPEWKINLLWKDYVNRSVGRNPYPAVEFSSPPDPNDVSPANFRIQSKHYRVAARSYETHKLVESIIQENSRALAEEFQRSKARNVEKILKNPI